MRQLFTLAATLITIAIGLSISLVAFAVLALLGSIVGVYFWWKTRALRRHLKQHLDAHTRSQKPMDEHHGTVIEGEWQHETPAASTPNKVDTDDSLTGIHTKRIKPPLSASPTQQ
jgi:hypothetical protein